MIPSGSGGDVSSATNKWGTLPDGDRHTERIIARGMCMFIKAAKTDSRVRGYNIMGKQMSVFSELQVSKGHQEFMPSSTHGFS